MTDLLQTAARDYIRMSEAGGCNLAIAHKMIGTVGQSRGDDLALRQGKALEPMIVDWLRDNGFVYYFDGDDQLELGCQDPYRVGHPDGIIGADATQITDWFKRNVPKVVQNLLLAGDLVLAEIKTMKPDDFTQFKKHGLDGTVFLQKYKVQIQHYLNTVADPSNDELWNSHRFRDLIHSYECERPTICLVIAYAPGLKRFAFDVVNIDPVAFKARSDELAKIPASLHTGMMPDPSWDGTAPDCYFCPFAHLCPPVIARLQEFELDSLTTDVVIGDVDVQRLDEAVARYLALRDDIKALELEQTELRANIELELANSGGNRIVTSQHIVKLSDVTGRKTLDTKAIEEIARIQGFELPYKAGKGFKRLYVNAIYGPSYERDGN